MGIFVNYSNSYEVKIVVTHSRRDINRYRKKSLTFQCIILVYWRNIVRSSGNGIIIDIGS